MKPTTAIKCLLILFLATLMKGCVKDPVIPPPDVTYKGGLAFSVTNDRGIAVQGVTISVALSQEDLHNGTYLAIKYTDITGRADFGLMNSGYYYYGAEILIDDISHHLEGVVQVQGGINITLQLQI